MFKLTPPPQVHVASRQQAEEAFNRLRYAVEHTPEGQALGTPSDWMRTHDPVSYAIVLLRRTGVRTTSPVGKWIDRHIYHTLGMAGWARAILGALTWADVCRLGPNPRNANEHSGDRDLVTQATQDVVDSQVANEDSEIVEQRLAGLHAGEAGTASKLDPDLRFTALADTLANRLLASQRIAYHHDDVGSRVGGSTLAGWVSGAYLTPLVERSGDTHARLAVSILVDTSGSTRHMLGELWGAACAIRNALLRVGHACAIDRWDGVDHTKEGPSHTPVVVDWHEGEVWRKHSAEGGTCLATSATPAMGRLQATAGAGARQLAIVITDGQTSDISRAQFLRLAACPCVYVTVNHPENPSNLLKEGWAAAINVASSGTCDIAESRALQALLGASD